MTRSAVALTFRRTPIRQVVGADGTLFTFKFENFQDSGSFKDRGISHFINTKTRENTVSRLIVSSGGNAGLSAALLGRRAGYPVEVFCPISTPALVVDKLRAQEALVRQAGLNWNEAHAIALERMQEDKHALLVPPFDHPLLWAGHASIVPEVYEQTTDSRPVTSIFLSVGGGGLLRGVQLGLLKNRKSGVDILAVETLGAHSFALATEQGSQASLPAITSIATSLGSLRVIPDVFNTDESQSTSSVVVTDKQALSACVQFADEFKTLVEPACGATLAASYYSESPSVAFGPDKHVVVVVCGGSLVNVEMIEKWRLEGL